MKVPFFDIEGEQERRWKELWGMDDDEWDRVWEYFFKLAEAKRDGKKTDRDIR